MQVLIVGSGGREHALAWKCAQSALVTRVFVAPGNAGTAREVGVENIDIDPLDFTRLVGFARENRIELTLVGPETPLVHGIVDIFNEAGLPIFGPSKRAAQLEGSKAFCKDFLTRHRIPTAWYGIFTDLAEAIDFIETKGVPIVIKADGLAAGKGVVVAHTETEARNAVKDMLAANRFGEAGARVVIEQFLSGEEASFIALVDGEDILPLATSQDHKARDDGDQGPNTGGMGAYSPAPILTPALQQRIMADILQPTVIGLAAEGTRYRGFLYAGIMVAADGTPFVLEYNCRLGDPETQPILMRLESDLPALCLAAVEGELGLQALRWSTQTALGVVMAAGGYPFDYAKGDPISGLAAAEREGCKVFHAGTASTDEGTVVTNGGRVLCVTALAATVADAQQKAYQAVDHISWPAAYYRQDIGHRAIKPAH